MLEWQVVQEELVLCTFPTDSFGIVAVVQTVVVETFEIVRIGT